MIYIYIYIAGPTLSQQNPFSCQEDAGHGFWGYCMSRDLFVLKKQMIYIYICIHVCIYICIHKHIHFCLYNHQKRNADWGFSCFCLCSVQLSQIGYLFLVAGYISHNYDNVWPYVRAMFGFTQTPRESLDLNIAIADLFTQAKMRNRDPSQNHPSVCSEASKLYSLG